MTRYIARRLILLVFTLFLVSLAVFYVIELLPGDTATIILGQNATPENIDKIESILRRVQLIDHQDVLATNLSHGQRQWLAISTLILAEPKLLLVDEPAAGLTDAETALTAELLLELKDEHTIIVIEHDMEFVRQLGSRVTVLNEGRVLAEGTLDQVQADEQVIEAYLGR